MAYTYNSKSVDQTRMIAGEYAKKCSLGTIIALNGDLGTGKTEFVRGFISTISKDTVVRSPSFSLVNTYDTPMFLVHHFDFYRLNNSDELFEIGFFEYLSDPKAVCIIEWASMFPEVLPEKKVTITFAESGRLNRIITIEPIPA